MHCHRNPKRLCVFNAGWLSIVKENSGPHSDLLDAGLISREVSVISSVKECATREYRCIRTSEFVMAVPRSGKISSGMSYSVEGAEHNVMGCYENIDKECSTFMVHAKCRSQPAATLSAERGIIKGEDCQ